MNATAIPNKCHCGHKNKNGSCRNCSRIKMAIMLPHSASQFKKKSANGQPVNPVWYNYLKNNRAGEMKIINGMLRRFKENHLSTLCTKVIFYDNQTKQPIAEVIF